MRFSSFARIFTTLTTWLGYGASLLEYGFGFMQYFIHPNDRTVHDRIAGTIIADKNR